MKFHRAFRRHGRTHRKLLSAMLAASLVVALPVSETIAQGEQAAGSLPPGAVELPPEALREHGQKLYDEYSEQATKITGDRDEQKRLLDANGEVLPVTTQVGILITRDTVVHRLGTFSTGLSAARDLSRNGKVTLAIDLVAKAKKVREAQAAYEQAKSNFGPYQITEDLYWNSMADATRLDNQGLTDDAKAMRARANDTRYALYVAAQERYVALLDETPLLGVQVGAYPSTTYSACSR